MEVVVLVVVEGIRVEAGTQPIASIFCVHV